MNIWQRYRKLNVWSKLAVWGGLASIFGLGVAFWPAPAGVRQHSQGSQSPNIVGNQNIVNSPNAQINAGPGERKFTTEQENSMVQALLAVPTSYAVIALENDQEAMKFAARVSAILTRAHWRNSALGYSLASFHGPVSGVWISCSSEESVEAGATLARLMTANGTPAKVTSPSGITPETNGGLTITIGHNDEMESQSLPPSIKQLSGSKNLLKP